MYFFLRIRINVKNAPFKIDQVQAESYYDNYYWDSLRQLDNKNSSCNVGGNKKRRK